MAPHSDLSPTGSPDLLHPRLMPRPGTTPTGSQVRQSLPSPRIWHRMPLAKPGNSPGKLGAAMDGEPGKHVGRRLEARRWRAALLWVGALAALALAAWIATHVALDLAGG